MATGKQENLDVVVIGAGFAGLYALYRFRDVLGLDVRVFETGDGVGGTWYWNRYPGARCDSESFYYSFSFSEELEQEWTWSSKYPEQPEILRYLEHVADRFDLSKDIQLSTRVTSAIYDEETNLWTVETDQGGTVVAAYVVTAVGCLSAANLPDIPGRDRFGGESYHTGAWPKEGVDFTGKRVALIGTGSSGIQSTPVIAAEADTLTVFQRTPNYTVPTRNAELSPEATRWIKENYPEIREKTRDTVSGFPYDPIERSAFEVSEEERNAIFERLWQEGGFKFMWGSFNDLMSDKAANDLAAEAEFFSFGTNDLTQTALGISRDDAGAFLHHYTDAEIYARDPFVSIDREGVGALVKIGVEGGRSQRPDIKLGVCGEHGGDPASIIFFEEVGLDYVSCSPYRVPAARLAAAQAAIRGQG